MRNRAHIQVTQERWSKGAGEVDLVDERPS